MNATKLIKNFISSEEQAEMIFFINSLFNLDPNLENEHIRTVRDYLKGESYIWDISGTNVSSYLANFQSSGNLLDPNQLPQIFKDYIKKISDKLEIDDSHTFLQIVTMNPGGKISPHYDTGYPGYINYKCNISLKSEDYKLFIDDHYINISESDLYAFEASLYKHWTEPFQESRILLSIGFALPYQSLGRSEEDPRVRMSNRIIKYFQKYDNNN